MLPDPAGKYGWIYNWIPKGDALSALAETARMTPDIDVSMDEAGTDMTGAGSTGAKETINEYKQLKAQEGPPDPGQHGRLRVFLPQQLDKTLSLRPSSEQSIGLGRPTPCRSRPGRGAAPLP